MLIIASLALNLILVRFAHSALPIDSMDLLGELQRCKFANSEGGRGFLDLHPLQTRNILEINIKVDTWEEAKEAMRVIESDPESHMFWAFWDEDIGCYNYNPDKKAFKAWFETETLRISDYNYDDENACVRYDYTWTAPDLPKHIYLKGNTAGLLMERGEGQYSLIMGDFNCMVSNNDPILREMTCLNEEMTWSDEKMQRTECLFENYNRHPWEIPGLCGKMPTSWPKNQNP